MIPQNKHYPINFMWPEKISYHNPVIGFNLVGDWCVRLQSGENTKNIVFNDRWARIDWSEITCLGISHYPDESRAGRITFNSRNLFSYKHYDFRKGERVVGIQAHKDGNLFYNLQLIIMGPK